MKNLVILDIGSNSVRMAINQINDNGTYREIKRVKSDSRLSQGMGRSKTLQSQAIKRTIKSLVYFKSIYTKYENTKVIGIATAAVRQAVNREAFLTEVKEAIGINVKVLTGNQEAYYDYLGVANRLGLKNCLILDIGGASCELIKVSRGKNTNLISIPMGAVNITERYHLSNRIVAANLFSARLMIKRNYAKIKWLKGGNRLPIVLLGGASRTLARINRRRQKMMRIDAIHGYHLSYEQVTQTYLNLIRENLAGRKNISGLETDRADIIVGGLLPLIVLMDHLDTKKVIFSESGVREGIITEYINQISVK